MTTARERLLPLLAVEPPAGGDAPWLDLVEGRPGSRGRVQDVWESRGGAGAYDLLLAGGDRLAPWAPRVLGGALLHDFYEVDVRLGLHPGETVLDLACGPGTLTRRLADAVGDDGLVIAADLSEPMLARATRAVPASNTVFVRADAMSLPLRDDTVDAVSCSLCLHLVPDLDTALDQIARVLRPGGRLAVAVPGHGRGPGRLLTEAMARSGQMRLFRRGELVEALVRHGFAGLHERAGTVMQIVDALAPA